MITQLEKLQGLFRIDPIGLGGRWKDLLEAGQLQIIDGGGQPNKFRRLWKPTCRKWDSAPFFAGFESLLSAGKLACDLQPTARESRTARLSSGSKRSETERLNGLAAQIQRADTNAEAVAVIEAMTWSRESQKTAENQAIARLEYNVLETMGA